jgi:hypothetical protein
MITVDWANKVVNIPRSYLTNVSGTLYELDTEAFRLDLHALESSDAGVSFERIHQHSTETVVAGTTYARSISIINGYSLTFEDDFYTVRLKGSNNNFFDVASGVLNQNRVQVIPQNSAGLIKVTSGSGVTEQDKQDIVNAIFNRIMP